MRNHRQLCHLDTRSVQQLDAKDDARIAGLCEGRNHAAGGAAGKGTRRPPAQVCALFRQHSWSLRCACVVTGLDKGCQGMQYMASLLLHDLVLVSLLILDMPGVHLSLWIGV